MASKFPFCARLTWLGDSQLSLELKTPAQWDPEMHTPKESECHGATRGRRGKLAQSLKLAVSIKEAESPGTLQRLLNQGLKRSGPHLSLKASLESVNSTVMRSGDPLGHFFHSLPLEHQQFILAKQRHADEVLLRAQQKAAARAAGLAYVEERPKKKATLLSHENMPASALAKTTRDPLKEQRFQNAQSLGTVTVEQKHEAEIASRLQRLYRITMLSRAISHRNLRHLAAVRIQRSLRGCYGRFYSALFAKVGALAVTQVAARYRVVMAMRQTELRRVKMNRAAKIIQASLRQYNAFHYVCWVRENWKHATTLANVVRKFLAHSRFELVLVDKVFQRSHTKCRQIVLNKQGQRQPLVLAFAAARLNAAIRGTLCRLSYYRKISMDVVQRVIVLAQRLLQRVARGQLGRRLALRSRQRRDSAVEIQRIVRGYSQIAWLKRLNWANHQSVSLVKLQKMARGYLDRIFVRLKQDETTQVRLRMVLVPHLQACIRRKLGLRVAQERAIAIVNSVRIQQIWRHFVLCREAKWEFQQRLLRAHAYMATHISRRLRGLFARKQYLAMRHAAAGHRLKSARIILRAWLRYRSMQRFAILKEEWEVEKSAKVLMAWHALRDDVHVDKADVRADIRDIRGSRKWARKRLKTLRNFVGEAELRLPKVETQMESLNISDVENGWAEALENEWERLTSQLAMAGEEKRLMKVHISRCDAELLDLELEYEDIEVDIDDIAAREQEEFELLRRLEIKRADVRANAGWQKRVRNERMRWRVRDVRARVLKRERRTRTELLSKAIKKREIIMSSTLSIHKRQRCFAEAKREATKEDHARRSEILAAAAADEAGALGKLKDTYDTVISGCAALMQSGTFEMRNITEQQGR